MKSFITFLKEAKASAAKTASASLLEQEDNGVTIPKSPLTIYHDSSIDRHRIKDSAGQHFGAAWRTLCDAEKERKKLHKKFNLKEDDGGAPTNSVGSGNIAGLGIPKAGQPSFGEPGVSPEYQRKRKQLKLMNGPPSDPRIFADKIFNHSSTSPQPKPKRS